MKKILINMAVILSLVFVSSLCFAEFELGEVSLSSGSGMEMHGYYEFEYWDIEGKRETFDAHKITIWMGKAINDKVYISGEFEWEHFPRHNDTNDDEPGGDGEIKLDSAQVSITPVKDTRAYVGVFYVPFGIEYESYPGHKNKLITRPKAFKSNNIIPGTWSDVGIGVEQKIAGVGKLDVYSINGDASRGGVSRDSSTGGNSAKSVGGRLSLDGIVNGLNIGGSYVSGRYSDDGNTAPVSSNKADLKATRWGAHLKADIDKLAGGNLFGLALIAEVVGGEDEMATGSGKVDSNGDPKDREVEGSYYQLSASPIKNIEVVVRYDIYDADTLATKNERTATSVGLNYSPYANTKLKIEHQTNEQESKPGAKDDVLVVGLVVDW